MKKTSRRSKKRPSHLRKRKLVRRPPSIDKRVDDLARRVTALENRASTFDEESERVAEQHRETMARKKAGETSIRWNADPAIRYRECALLHPNARVRFRQLEPFDDDNIPSLHIALARDYDAVIAHLRDKHWRGERASYKWTVCDDMQPQWATGIIQFAARLPQPPPPYPPVLPPDLDSQRRSRGS